MWFIVRAGGTEIEILRVTALNVMGVFVTDVKSFLLEAVASWARLQGVRFLSDSSSGSLVFLLRMGVGLFGGSYLVAETPARVTVNLESQETGLGSPDLPLLCCVTLRELCSLFRVTW